MLFLPGGFCEVAQISVTSIDCGLTERRGHSDGGRVPLERIRDVRVRPIPEPDARFFPHQLWVQGARDTLKVVSDTSPPRHERHSRRIEPP